MLEGQACQVGKALNDEPKQRTNDQDGREESPLEPPPGVPMGSETPLEDEEETGSGSDDKAGSEDRG